MSAAKRNLTIEKGAKYTKTFVWRDSAKSPIDISGLQARMQIRETLTSDAFAVELTTINGRIVLEAGGETGRIDLILGATITDAITITSGVFDFELYNDSDPDDVNRLIEGVVSIVSGVTR
jgi:hypothetical protein